MKNDRYLYRAKRKNWRELPKEIWWIEGYYAYFKQNDNHCIYYERDGFTLVCDIDIFTLCACTGLNDKNGKLIWENDIVKRKFRLFSSETKYEEKENCGVVKYDESYARFGYQCSVFAMLGESDKYDTLEVIGNIFDNPELWRWENDIY